MGATLGPGGGLGSLTGGAWIASCAAAACDHASVAIKRSETESRFMRPDTTASDARRTSAVRESKAGASDVRGLGVRFRARVLTTPPSALLRRPITTGLALAAIGTTLLSETGSSINALVMTPAAVGPEPWRLLTSALPHIGAIHLVFNIYWLLMLGGAIEARRGAREVSALIVLTAIGSAAFEHALFSGGVGLSGIVYGLFGFCWMAARAGMDFGDVVDKRTVQTFLAWFVFCCISTLTGVFEVANAAHAGGLAVGVLAGMAVAQPSRRGLGYAATLALTALFVVLASRPVRSLVNVHGLSQDLADEAYARIDTEPEAAIAGYDLAIGREPDVANWHYNRGVALQRVGHETDADAAYARAFALAPDDAAHREAVAGTHARRANEAMAELREEDALLELRAAIALVPSHPFATEWRRAALELEAASDAEAGQWSEGGDEGP